MCNSEHKRDVSLLSCSHHQSFYLLVNRTGDLLDLLAYGGILVAPGKQAALIVEACLSGDV